MTGQAPETAARGSESFVRRRLLLQPLLRLLLLLYVACGQKASRRGSQTVGSPAQPQPAYSLVLSAHNLPLLLLLLPLLFGYQYAASVLATRRKQFPSQAKPSRSEAKRSALAPSLASGLGPRDFNLTPFGGILRLPLCSIVEAFYMANDRHNRQQDERQDPNRDNRRQPHTYKHTHAHVLHVCTEVNNRSKY